MIPIGRLYFIAGVTMVSLLVSMVLDSVIPIVSSIWIEALAHPFIPLTGILLLLTLAYERSVSRATLAFFTASIIVLTTMLLNEALISMVASGRIPVTLSVLASLSVHNRLGWWILGANAIAGVLSGAFFASSVLIAIIIGASLPLLIMRSNDA